MVVKRQIIVGILLIAAASTFFLWGDSGTPVTAPIILTGGDAETGFCKAWQLLSVVIWLSVARVRDALGHPLNFPLPDLQLQAGC